MARSSNFAGAGRPSCMKAFDKLPKALREELYYADHNWSGEQLYQQFKKRNPKVRTIVLAKAFLKAEDAKKHVRDTADFYCGVMPGQREIAQ